MKKILICAAVMAFSSAGAWAQPALGGKPSGGPAAVEEQNVDENGNIRVRPSIGTPVSSCSGHQPFPGDAVLFSVPEDRFLVMEYASMTASFANAVSDHILTASLITTTNGASHGFVAGSARPASEGSSAQGVDGRVIKLIADPGSGVRMSLRGHAHLDSTAQICVSGRLLPLDAAL